MVRDQPESSDEDSSPVPQDDPYPEWGFNEVDPEIETAPGTIEISGAEFPYDRYGRANPGGEVFIDSTTSDGAAFHALGISDSNQNVVRLAAPLFGSNNNVTFDLSGDGDGDPVTPGSYVVINAVGEEDPRAFQPLCVQAYEGTITGAVSGPTPTVTVTTTALVDAPPAIEDPQLVVWNDTVGEQRVVMDETGDGTFEGTLTGFSPGQYSLHALLRDGTGENAQVVGLSQPATVEVVAQTGLTFAVDGQPDALTVDEGVTVPYSATAEFEDGSTEDVTDQVTVAVTGGDPAIVDIDESAAEITGTAPGTVTLEGDDGGFTDSVEVTVEETQQVGLAFAVDGQSDAVTIDEGATVPYSATAEFEDGSTEDVTDQVSVAVSDGGSAVVDIDENAAEVTGTGPGTVTLEGDDGGFTDSVEVTVEAMSVGELTFADQQFVDGGVTVASVTTAQPSTVLVTYEDGDAEVVAGFAAADSLDDEPVTVDIEDDSAVPGAHTASVFEDADVPADLGIGDDASSIAGDALDADTATVATGGLDVTLPGETIPPSGEASLDIVGSGVETLTVEALWTDWDVAATDADGAETTDAVQSAGQFELTWESQQAAVAPTVAVTPPERYVGGEYELVVTGVGGDGSTAADTATLAVDGEPA